MEFECSCGRSFSHRISLKRHMSVAGCAPVEKEATPKAEPEALEKTVKQVAPQRPEPAKPEAKSSRGSTRPTSPRPPASEEEPSGLAPEPDELEPVDLDELHEVLLQARETQLSDLTLRRPGLGERCLALTGEFVWWLASQLHGGGGLLSQGARAFIPVVGGAIIRAGAILLVLVAGLVVGISAQARSGSVVVVAPARAATRPVSSRAKPEPQPLTQGPESTVVHFYQSVNRGSLGLAYGRLSPEWQRELPYLSFEAGYLQTSAVDCKVIRSVPIGPGRTQVDVVLDVCERGRQVQYHGYYVVVDGAEGWLLDGGRFSPG